MTNTNQTASPEQQSDYDNGEESDEDRDLGRRRLAELFAAGDVPDLDTIAGPLFWPGIPSADITAEWDGLRRWVERLVARYPHLDHHVIPRCWWRHPGHVEALQALRDHERVSFADSAAATAATDWQWRFALIEGRLREWTAHAGCGASHREPTIGVPAPDLSEWEEMVAADQRERAGNEVDGMVAVPGGER
jgi:hypothetical protein